MANNCGMKHVILTGLPGVGKTTLVKKCCELLKDSHVNLQGFFTEELREHGKRTGFDVVTLDGQRGALARVKESDEAEPGGGARQPMVGQYRVKVTSFENIAIPALLQKKSTPSRVVVIDEVGKMEMFSAVFVRTVKQILSQKNTVLFATIPVPRGKPIPLVEEIRNHKQAQVFEVTKENRDCLLEDIKSAVLQSYTDCTS